MTSVPLAFTALGKPENPVLIILHGLLGSSRNWLGVGKILSDYFNVFLLDLRNHGSSPHSDSMSYPDMVNDLCDWVDKHNIHSFYLLGHSLGGKIAMTYACRHPERLLGLIVEDIAPKEYDLRYAAEFEAMNNLDLEKLKNRNDADQAMEAKIPDWTWRQFLLTNLARDENKKFHWQINLPVLTRWLPEIMQNPIKDNNKYTGPTLFLRGETSDFITNDDYPIIHKHFPQATIIELPHTGHNVHIENTPALVDALKSLLKHSKPK